MNRQMHIKIYGQIDKYNIQMERQIDEQMDIQINKQIDRQKIKKKKIGKQIE